jgi:hypothetical protein
VHFFKNIDVRNLILIFISVTEVLSTKITPLKEHVEVIEGDAMEE